jgi:hypothetical protein
MNMKKNSKVEMNNEPDKMSHESLPAEWTFERARKHWKPMTRAVQHVGVPGYQFQAGIMWDGSIAIGPHGARNLEVMKQELAPLGNQHLHVAVGYGKPMRLVDHAGAGHPNIRRWLEGGRLPMPHVETRDGEIVWQESAFAYLLDRPLEEGLQPKPTNVLITDVRFAARNTGLARKTAHLWLHFGDATEIKFGYKCTQGENLSPAIPHEYQPPYGIMDNKIRYMFPLPATGTIRCHHDAESVAGSQKPANQTLEWLEWEIPLAPGEEAEARLIVPYGLITREAAERLLAIDRSLLWEKVHAFWQKLQYGPGQITTTDAFINDYLVAVAGQAAQQTGFRHSTGVWMYKTSPNHYESYWPCNAAKALPMFDLRGLTNLSRNVLQSFITTQSDDVRGMDKGAAGRDQRLKGEGYDKRFGFLGNFGAWTANPLLISHGLEMWALAAHFRITRDRQWLGTGPGSPLQAMLDAFDWVSTQRRRTMRDENGRKVAHWGLLPAASAHDWLAGNVIHNDAFCIYGMSEIVRLLREVGHDRAEELMQELNDYRVCLRDRYREARDQAKPLPLPDGTTIPYMPRMVQELDWAKPDWTYTGYGPLRAGAYGALDPFDPMVDQALAYLEAGMPKGQGHYIDNHLGTADDNWLAVNDRQAPRHYHWRHYVEYETMWPIGGQLFLERDDLPRFFEWLFHNLSVVLHHDWRVGVESLDGVPSCAPGDGERWQMIRRMFVNERGGYDGSQQSLWLLQAMPREWLKPGNRLAVKEMGTLFGGKIDLELEMARDGNSVLVSAKFKLSVKPTEIRMRLRSGDGRPLLSAKINGKKAEVRSDDTIALLLATEGEYRIEGYF